jgi:hypothetical protein
MFYLLSDAAIRQLSEAIIKWVTKTLIFYHCFSHFKGMGKEYGREERGR